MGFPGLDQLSPALEWQVEALGASEFGPLHGWEHRR